jgi:choline transport protein
MLYSIVINGALAFGLIICLLYTLGDPEAALATPTGYPLVEMLYNATGSKVGTSVLVGFICFNGIVAFFGALASVSRLTWKFARDGGLPFSDFFGYGSAAR